jgi:hypothetical protein
VAVPSAGFDLDQNDPRCLDEQHTQVSIASLRYFAKDRAVPGRYLFGDEAKPRSEVSPLGEGIASANRSNHSAGDDRSDAGNAHQPFAPGILFGEFSDLSGYVLDALIEPPPVGG